MSVRAGIDPAVWQVIEDYEARAERDEQLWNSLSEQEVRQRLDEFLLPVGRATATLMNLLIKEGEARRILEVGSSYGYSTTWLTEAARAVGGKVISLELKAAKTEYARAQRPASVSTASSSSASVTRSPHWRSSPACGSKGGSSFASAMRSLRLRSFPAPSTSC